jgi:hypothetical protein
MCNLSLALPLNTNRLGDSLTDTLCTGRVLAGDELAAVHGEDELTPRLGGLLVCGADLLDLVLEKEGHKLSHLRLVLLHVREAGGLLAGEQVLAVGQDHVGEHDGAVAHGGNGLAGGNELVDQGDAVLVGGEVEHGAVSSRVEQGSELGRPAQVVGQLARVLPERLLSLKEVGR